MLLQELVELRIGTDNLPVEVLAVLSRLTAEDDEEWSLGFEGALGCDGEIPLPDNVFCGGVFCFGTALG
ncbi:MAG: hypothetical protein GY946_06475 [bacterium]|nr:hypothetical protein [bacterium]